MRRYRTHLCYRVMVLNRLNWPWWVKICTEDFTDVTLAIDDAGVGDGGGVHGGWQGGRWGGQNKGWQGGQHGADLTLTIDDTCGDGWVVMGVVDMEVANMVKWNLSKKWKGAMAHDVSPVAMFLIPNTESVLIVNLFFYRRRSWTTWMSGMIISSVRSSLHHNVPL